MGRFGVKEKLSKYGSLWVILLFFIAGVFIRQPWKGDSLEQKTIYWDVISYYAYLPATFIHGDLSLGFLKKPVVDSNFINLYWPTRLENGNEIIKTTMGWAILNVPAFFLGHTYAKLFGHTQDGFSTPYQVAIAFNNVLFCFLGFLYLFRLLSTFFQAKTVQLTMICVAFGTNIFYYTSFTNPISHCYEFTLILMFLWYSLRWYETPQAKILYFLGLLLGFIILIRPLNLIVVIIPLLFHIDQKNFVHKQWALVKTHYKHLLIAGLCVFFVILPQLLYWRVFTGNWVFNSYVGEQFFWSRPMVAEFLFSYRKGWLLYTPMMAVMLFGFIIQKRNLNQILPQILILLLIMIWFNACWWCWWFGGTFGCRVLIDFYGLFALPLAVVIEYCFSRHLMFRLSFAILLSCVVFINLFQTRQKLEGQIHWDSMTKEAYWEVFLKRRFPENYEKLLKTPDYEAAKRGDIVR